MKSSAPIRNWTSFWIAALAILAFSGCHTARDRFYPVGIYSIRSTNDLAVVRDAGFNLVAGSATESFLDSAKAQGLKVLASPGSQAGPGFNSSRVRRTVSALDRHPALWAWYVIDEPDLNRVSPGDVRAANRFIKSLRPTKPTALVLFRGEQALHYANITDILMLDRYPIPWLPLASFPQHVAQARLAIGPKKPLIAVIQAFDWSYYPKLLPGETNLRPPNAAELRCMAYCALSQSADGLFFYCFNDGKWKMDEHPEVWDALKSLVAEIHERLPLFQAEHVWWPYQHTYDDRSRRFNAALETSIIPRLVRVKRGNEHVLPGDYIVAINTTPESHRYHVELPFPIEGLIPVLGEERSVEPQRNLLSDDFAPFAVHVYQLGQP